MNALSKIALGALMAGSAAVIALPSFAGEEPQPPSAEQAKEVSGGAVRGAGSVHEASGGATRGERAEQAVSGGATRGARVEQPVSGGASSH